MATAHLNYKLTKEKVFYAFIITYIPFGLFLYTALNLQFIDEFYTLLLLFYFTYICVLRKQQIKKEFAFVVFIFLFYYAYSVFFFFLNWVSALYDL